MYNGNKTSLHIFAHKFINMFFLYLKSSLSISVTMWIYSSESHLFSSAHFHSLYWFPNLYCIHESTSTLSEQFLKYEHLFLKWFIGLPPTCHTKFIFLSTYLGPFLRGVPILFVFTLHYVPIYSKLIVLNVPPGYLFLILSAQTPLILLLWKLQTKYRFFPRYLCIYPTAMTLITVLYVFVSSIFTLCTVVWSPKDNDYPTSFCSHKSLAW